MHHLPVLLSEVLSQLAAGSKWGGPAHILDGTFGGGGHTRAILEAHPEHRVTALDRDPAAAVRATCVEASYPGRFIFQGMNFASLGDLEAGSFDGILLDLGLSSFQLDDPSRGFSFRFGSGPADMRMNPAEGLSAGQFLEEASHGELVRAVRDFGEEPRWRSVVEALENARGTDTLFDIAKLAALVARTAACGPRGRVSSLHPATRTFQGIRIAINGELEALEKALPAAFERLAVGGVLAVISFHSLEDRRVKRFFNLCAGRPLHGKDNTAQQDRLCLAELLTRKAIAAGPEELQVNPRARSARLRALRKIADLPAGQFQFLDFHQTLKTNKTH